MSSDAYNEFAASRKALEDQGYKLNPFDFEPIRLWTHLLHEYIWAEVELKSLIATRPRQFDGDNTYPYFGRFYTVIVTHCRPFMSGGNNIPRLEAKRVFKDEPVLRLHHDKMVGIRNAVVAHTDHHELVRTDIAVKETDKDFRIQISIEPKMPTPQEMEQFLAVITHTGHQMKIQMNKLMDRIGKKLGKPIEEDR